MRKLTYILLLGIALMSVVSACSSNKAVPVEAPPPRNPIALAQEAAGTAQDAFESNLFSDAIRSYESAISLFNEVAQTASETDSIPHNIERMKLNIATCHDKLAGESFADQIYAEAVAHYDSALVIYNSLQPLTITTESLNEYKMKLYKNLSITHQKNGTFEEAVRYCDMILASQPNNEETLNFKYSILKNDIKDAERAFGALKQYAEASNDANAYIILAGKYAEAQNNEQATLYYEKALQLRTDANTLKALANFYRQTSQWAKSNEILLRWLALNPEQNDLLTAYRLLGDNYNKLNNKPKMAEYFEKAIAIEVDPTLALALASYYNGASNWAKVISNATLVLRSNPRDSNALMLRGLAYFKTNRFNEAKIDLELIKNDARHGTNATNLLNNINNRRN